MAEGLKQRYNERTGVLTLELDEERKIALARRESYRRGLLHGRQIQKRHERHDRCWNYSACVTIAGIIGAWLGVIAANWRP